MRVFDEGTVIEIDVPKDFNFEECLAFLGRSDQEVLHHIEGKTLHKLINLKDELILIKISSNKKALRIGFPLNKPSDNDIIEIIAYVNDLFDLHRDLSGFYELSMGDPVLHQVTKKHAGLRIVGIPNLFEALTWAIMGQQINLSFAYTLKKRIVERYGKKLDFEGRTYWVYPSPKTIANTRVEDLKELQFTTRKAEYLIGVAKMIAAGELTKESLLMVIEPERRRDILLAIRGVGAWTADYVMMKCLLEPTAFPIADVGVHNAIKVQLGLDAKPDIHEIKKLATGWSRWEAYATFYLWRSLYD